MHSRRAAARAPLLRWARLRLPWARLWLPVCLALAASGVVAALLAREPAGAAPARGVVGGACDEAQLAAALAGGGVVSFACAAPLTITFSAEKLITLPTTIDGANGGLGGITFSGGGSVRLFHVAAGAQLTLAGGLTLVDGSAPAPGGALLVDAGGAAVVEATRFERNQAASGGALASSGELLVTGSQFNANSAAGDGGALWSGGPLSVASSTFSANQARQGGALFAAAPLTVTQSVFSANSAAVKGGAIFVAVAVRLMLRAAVFSGQASPEGVAIFAQGPADIGGSTFYANGDESSGNGGAIETWSRLDVLNSTFSQNHAYHAGGIYVQAGQLLVTHTTFVSNTAGAAGRNGGNILAASGVPTFALQIGNSVLSGGAPNNCFAALASLGGNVEDTASCGFNQPGDRSGLDPRLGPLQANTAAPGAVALTHMPLPGSPLIDAALLSACPADDERGSHRPSGTGCDVGAVEVTQPLWLPLVQR